jgi:hypothetical protein
MKKAIVLALALLLAASSSYALTNGRDGSGGYGPIGDGYAMYRAEADVLVYQVREANAGFADMIPLYSAAITAAGGVVTAIDAPTGVSGLPGNYDPVNFPVTFVITGENWWGPNFIPADETTVGNYLNAGGALFFSGQDYLYGAGYGDGAAYGFPLMIGAGTIVQDTPFGTGYYMEVSGSDIWAGAYMALDCSAIFLANDFYPDTIEPRAEAAVLATQESPEYHNGAVIYDAGAYKSIFTTLEIACDQTGQFGGLIGTAYAWLGGGVVATESTTWGAVKANFR